MIGSDPPPNMGVKLPSRALEIRFVPLLRARRYSLVDRVDWVDTVDWVDAVDWLDGADRVARLPVRTR